MRISQIFQFLTIVLAPLYILRIPFFTTIFENQTIHIGSNLLEILLLLSVIVTAIYFFTDRAKISDLKTEFDTVILFFLLAVLIATIMSTNFLGGVGIFRAYFIEPVLFFYALVYESKKSGFSYIILALLLSGVWLSLLSLLQFITGSYTLAPYEMALGRVSAVYNSANSLALYLGPIAIIVLTLFLMYRKNYHKLLALVLFIFFTLVMIWTKSRGGLVSEAIALAVLGFGISTIKKISLRKFWLSVPLLLTFFVVLFFLLLYNNYKSLPATLPNTYSNGDTLQIRYKLWSNTIGILQKHPIFGAGLDGFRALYKGSYTQIGQEELFQYPHNIFLNFWVETGIAGLFLYIFLHIQLFRVLFRKIYSRVDPVFGFGLMAVFVYWIMHGLVDVPYFKNDLSLEFWVFLALVQIFSRRKQTT